MHIFSICLAKSCPSRYKMFHLYVLGHPKYYTYIDKLTMHTEHLYINIMYTICENISENLFFFRFILFFISPACTPINSICAVNIIAYILYPYNIGSDSSFLFHRRHQPLSLYTYLWANTKKKKNKR